MIRSLFVIQDKVTFCGQMLLMKLVLMQNTVPSLNTNKQRISDKVVSHKGSNLSELITLSFLMISRGIEVN